MSQPSPFPLGKNQWGKQGSLPPALGPLCNPCVTHSVCISSRERRSPMERNQGQTIAS